MVIKGCLNELACRGLSAMHDATFPNKERSWILLSKSGREHFNMLPKNIQPQ